MINTCNITMVLITPEHKELVYDIFRDIHPELTGIEGIVVDQLEELLRLQFEMRQVQFGELYPNAERKLIVYNDMPVGYVYFETGNDIRVIEIGLLKRYRRNGIGSYIIRTLIDKANAEGKNISLQVLWFNNSACQFYQKLGFSLIHYNGIAYEMIYKCNTNNLT